MAQRYLEIAADPKNKMESPAAIAKWRKEEENGSCRGLRAKAARPLRFCPPFAVFSDPFMPAQKSQPKKTEEARFARASAEPESAATAPEKNPELNARALAQAVVTGLLSAGAARSALAQGFGDAALNAAGSPELQAEIAAWLVGLSTQTHDRARLFESKNPQSKIPESVGLVWAAIAAPSWKTAAGAQALQRACVRPFPALADFMRRELESWGDKDRMRLARRLLASSSSFLDVEAVGEGMEPVLKTLASTPGREREAIELLSRHWRSARRGAGWQFAWLVDEALASPPEERLQMLRVGVMAWPWFLLKNHYDRDAFAWSEALADSEMGKNWTPERWIEAASEGEKAHDAFFEINEWDEEESGASGSIFADSPVSDSEGNDEGPGAEFADLEPSGFSSIDEELFGLDDLARTRMPLDKRLRTQLEKTGTFEEFDRMRAPSALWRAAKAEPDFWNAAYWRAQPEAPTKESALIAKEQLPFTLENATRWSRFLSLALMNGRGWPLEQLSEWKPEGESAQLPLDCWSGIARSDWRGAGAFVKSMERAGRSWGMAPARDGGEEGRAGAIATLPWGLMPDLASVLRRALSMAAAAEQPWAGWARGPKKKDLANALLRAASGEGEHENARFKDFPGGSQGLAEGVMALGRRGFDFDRAADAKGQSFASLWVSAVASRFKNSRISDAHIREEMEHWADWAPKAIEAAQLEAVVAAEGANSATAAKSSKGKASAVVFPAQKIATRGASAQKKTRRI